MNTVLYHFNFILVTRQMKTLTYSLASTKCMDDGWTVRPLSPIGTESGDHLEPFEIEINSSRAQVNHILFFCKLILTQTSTYSPFLIIIIMHPAYGKFYVFFSSAEKCLWRDSIKTGIDYWSSSQMAQAAVSILELPNHCIRGSKTRFYYIHQVSQISTPFKLSLE